MLTFAMSGWHRFVPATSILGNGAPAETPAPMYAYFPTKQIPRGRVSLQVAESGTVDIDLNKLKAESRG